MFIYMYCCVCLYTYVYVYAYMFVCTCGCLACIYIYLYVLVACYSVSDSFGEIRTVAGDPDPIQVQVVVDPIQWEFEDRCMGWFVDQYRFVQ